MSHSVKSVRLCTLNGFKFVSMRFNRAITGHSKNVHLNQLSDSVRNEWINTAQSFVRDPIAFPIGVCNTKIIDMIDEQTNGAQLLHIIINNKHDMIHNCIYNKAMQKCGMLQDWNSIHKIMKLLMSNECIKPDLVSFNIFINNMALSDSPEICIKYFNIMTEKYDITPDVITFSSIIKSLRRQTNYKQAETYWKLMTEKYKLCPHNIVYCEMISTYSRAKKTEHATKIFNQYIDTIQNNEIEADVVIFNAFLNGFSRCGDLNGMQNVVNLFMKYGLKLTENTMADIMRGCIMAKEYKQCIHIIQEWMDNGNKANITMMSLKCIALAQMIDNNLLSFNEKYKLYLRLKKVIYSELQFYGLSVSQNIAKIQLDGAIFLYESHDPIQIVNVFEWLISKQLIGYQTYDKITGKLCIDLHLFSLSQSQFIVRYLFGFKLNEIVTLQDNEVNEPLLIIVGRGKHSTGHKNKNANLRQFIINELLSWNPPINCHICTSNNGVLVINKADLMPYLKDKTEFTMIQHHINNTDEFKFCDLNALSKVEL